MQRNHAAHPTAQHVGKQVTGHTQLLSTASRPTQQGSLAKDAKQLHNTFYSFQEQESKGTAPPSS